LPVLRSFPSVPTRRSSDLENRDKKGLGPAGNREIACLSSIFNHGMRIRACNVNPCYGVRRNTEKPRTRAVTDKELRQALRSAHRSEEHTSELQSREKLVGR